MPGAPPNSGLCIGEGHVRNAARGLWHAFNWLTLPVGWFVSGLRTVLGVAEGAEIVVAGVEAAEQVLLNIFQSGRGVSIKGTALGADKIHINDVFEVQRSCVSSMHLVCCRTVAGFSICIGLWFSLGAQRQETETNVSVCGNKKLALSARGSGPPSHEDLNTKLQHNFRPLRRCDFGGVSRWA